MFNDPYPDLFGNYITRKFSDIFPEEEIFLSEYKESGLYSKNKISDESAKLLYYLLYARYGNSTIASSDENQFKYKVYSTIFMHGPTWEKRLEIQDKLRALTDEEITTGTKRIFNIAFNPSTAPSTASMEELPTINQQNADHWKKSKLDGYNALIMLIDTDVTEEFIGKFKKLFITITQPNLPLWYETKEGEPE